MEIKVGDKVRVNQVGMATDSSDEKAWRCIGSAAVDQVKHMRYLTVIAITDAGSLKVVENSCFWPADMFEVIPEEGIVLSQEEKDILRELLQSRADIYIKLIDKLR